MSQWRNIFWAVTIGLVLTLFVSVGYDATVLQHFFSWSNWPTVEIESAWVRAWRTFIEVLGIAVYPISLGAGTYLGWKAVHGRAKPLAATIGASLLCALLGEWTSGFGQDGTRADAQNMSPVSLVVVISIVAVPVVFGALATRKPTEDPPRTVGPLLPNSTQAD